MPVQRQDTARPLAAHELERMQAWWRAANYLSVGQVYLMDNPLLREKLTAAHVKPRLLGHFGTVPGLNFIYLHLNRGDQGAWTSACCSSRVRGRRVRAWSQAGWLGWHLHKCIPTSRRDEDGMRRCVQAVLLPWRRSKPCRAEATVDYEGGEVGLLPVTRVWRRAGTTPT